MYPAEFKESSYRLMATRKSNKDLDPDAVPKRPTRIKTSSTFLELIADRKIFPLYFIGMTCIAFSIYHLNRVGYSITALRYWITLFFGAICTLIPFIGAVLWVVAERYGSVHGGKIVSITSKKRVSSIGAGKIWALDGKAEIYLASKTIIRDIYISGERVSDLDVGDDFCFLVYPSKNPRVFIPISHLQ